MTTPYTAYCKETNTITFAGAGDAGVHSSLLILPPGEYSITAGGTASSATLSVKLKDSAGNLFDIPKYDFSAAATLPGSYPVKFSCPGLTLVVSTTGATSGTAPTITVGPVNE